MECTKWSNILEKNTIQDDYLSLVNNCEYGVLRAQWTAPQKYLKKHSDIFWYQGKEIFHYTDLIGLIGILANKGFWLSDVRFLNDSEEIINGAKLSIELIERLLTKNKYKPFTAVLEGTVNELVNEPYDNHYICCFSTGRDTLEQWRAYAKNGSGICIGFDLNKKTNYPHFMIGNQYSIQKVIYDDQQKKWILISVIRKYFNEFIRDINEHSHDYTDDYIEHMAYSLSSVFVNFKNKAFHTEQEIRLVNSSKRVNFYNKKKFRASNNMIIPYYCTYDTKFANSSGQKIEPDNLPVSQIIVGPVASQNATINSIREFISSQGYDEKIPIIKSTVPYRG